jgi:hypothetical protein
MPRHDQRLRASCAASSIDALTSGLAACASKQPFVTLTSNQHKPDRNQL